MSQKQVTFVNPVDPVGSQIALQQLQRQQAMADALRERSFQPLQGNGGNIAWTQGLAQIGQALAARIMQNRIDKRTADVGYQAANATRAMFGVPPIQPVEQPKAPIAEQMAPNAAPQPTGNVPGASDMLNGQQPPQMPPQAPQQAPQVAPQEQAPQQPPQQAGGYPMSLTGDPQTDYGYYIQNPDKYTEAVIAAHAPTDLMKTLAASGIPLNSPLAKQILQANIAHQNYTAPVNGRPGSTLRDPYDPTKVIGYDAPTVDGGIPIYGPDGQFQGYKAAPGAASITANMTAAKAGAEAGAKAPYELIQVWNPTTGQMELRPKSDATGGGSPTATGGGRGAGPIDAALSGGHFAAGPRLGAQSAANTAGTGSANAFTAIQEQAQDVPTRLMALRQSLDLVNKGVLTGPGAQSLQHWQGLASTFGIPFAGKDVSDATELNKWLSQYSARAAQDLGLSGSDARIALTVQATPNGHMQPNALKHIIPRMIGMEMGKAAYATAAGNWMQTHGADTNAQFQTEWRKNYDPTLFTAMQWGPESFKNWVKSLKPEDQQKYKAKYMGLKAMGAIQ